MTDYFLKTRKSGGIKDQHLQKSEAKSQID